MKLKSISFRMVLLALLLVFVSYLSTACGSKEEKENPSGEYRLYSMETGGESYSNEDIVTYGLDKMNLILFEDGSGQMGFDNETDAFTWADNKISMGDESMPFELKDGMLTLTEDSDTLVFERVGDAPKKAEIVENPQENIEEDILDDSTSKTDEMTEPDATQ